MSRPTGPRRPGAAARPGDRGGRDAAHRRYLDAYTQRGRAVDLEERLAAAWPARSVLELDGWRLRLGVGLPPLAASAWPRADGGRVPLDVRLDGVARFYHEAGRPARVQIGPAARPSGLDAALAQRGWQREHPHQLRTASVTTLRASAAAEEAPTGEATTALVATTTSAAEPPPADWLAAWAERGERAPAEAEGAAIALGRVGATTHWVRARGPARDAGLARGVLDGGWLGIADLDAATEQAGAALLGELLSWATARGAEHAWWLVPERDALADRLARGAGLRTGPTVQLRVLPRGMAPGGSR